MKTPPRLILQTHLYLQIPQPRAPLCFQAPLRPLSLSLIDNFLIIHSPLVSYYIFAKQANSKGDDKLINFPEKIRLVTFPHILTSEVL